LTVLNKIFLQGRLVADPELNKTPSGILVCSFRIAVDRDYKDKQTGEREADFINVETWRQTAEFVAQNFSKGRIIIVVGHLRIRQYTDKEGNKRTVADAVAENVYFGDSKPASSTSETMTSSYLPAGQRPNRSAPAGQQEQFEELNDDGQLPF